jgi:hypothetical protein
MGIAFDMGNGKVLKVTSDEREAKTSFKLKGKQNQFIAPFDDVFKFKESEIYGIIQPKMEPLSDQEKREFDDLIAMVEGAENHGSQALTGPPGHREGGTGDDKTAFDILSTGTWEELVKKMGDSFADEALADGAGPANIRKVVMQKLQRFTLAAKKYKLPEMMAELRSAGIEFGDYHGGNLMKLDGRYVVNDLGLSKTNGAIDPPQLEALVREFTHMLLTDPQMPTISAQLGSSPFSSGPQAITTSLHAQNRQSDLGGSDDAEDVVGPFSIDKAVEHVIRSLVKENQQPVKRGSATNTVFEKTVEAHHMYKALGSTDSPWDKKTIDPVEVNRIFDADKRLKMTTRTPDGQYTISVPNSYAYEYYLLITR